jgi:lysozyme
LKLDQVGVDFIQSQEGLRLSVYEDEAGVWTIGYGHTAGVTQDTPDITENEALNFLDDDLEICEECITNSVSITLTQNEFNALVSFTFNEGRKAFRESTLLEKLNNGDKQGAAKQFLRWVYIHKNGSPVVDNDLVTRREKEMQMFLSDFNLQKESAKT